MPLPDEPSTALDSLHGAGSPSTARSMARSTARSAAPAGAAGAEPPLVRLTLRLADYKARRLREVARQRGLSVNGLLDELASLALFEFELAQRGPQAHQR